MDVKRFYDETGSNYQTALSIMMNDVLIERMLKMFMEKNAYNAIIEAYKANNIKEVFLSAHALKGVAGNLALTKLYEIACELTEATRDKEETNIDNEVEKLISQYQLIEEKYKSLVG